LRPEKAIATARRSPFPNSRSKSSGKRRNKSMWRNCRAAEPGTDSSHSANAHPSARRRSRSVAGRRFSISIASMVKTNSRQRTGVVRSPSATETTENIIGQQGRGGCWEVVARPIPDCGDYRSLLRRAGMLGHRSITQSISAASFLTSDETG